MATAFPSPSWYDALQDYLTHLTATRATKTVRFYRTQLRGLVHWADDNGISLDQFGKRHLDQYLAARVEVGLSKTTLHHDALAAKVFFKWCQRNDVVARSRLGEYEVRKAPAPAKYMPSDEDMGRLLSAIPSFWDPRQNPDAEYSSAPKRLFHRERNYAITLLLLDSACRIGEVLSLKMDDWQPGMLTVRESKGREPRAIPVSAECAEAVEVWRKVRARVMQAVPKGEDAGWLFVSETGARIDEGRFLRALKKVRDFAELPDRITLHSLRRYSLNRLAKHNLLAAQAIAGHKDTKTTLIYTKIDPDFVRAMHEEVGVVRGILGSRRPDRKKRLV